MTMPTLIANYQKEVTVTQLKKSYSMWNQVFQKVLADEGVDRLSDTELWSKMPGKDCTPANFDTDCKDFITILQKYINFDIYPFEELQYKFNYKKTPDFISASDGTSILVVKDGTLIADGSFLYNPNTKDEKTCKKIKELGGSFCSEAAAIAIDINGLKKPNTIGKDVFMFDLSNEGKLYPYFCKDFALFFEQRSLEINSFYWKNQITYIEDINFPCDKDGGVSCAARIMENGWKIDY